MDELCEAIESRLGVVVIGSGAGATQREVVANYCALPTSQLIATSSAQSVTLKFLEGDHIRVRFRLIGTGQVSVGRDQVLFTESTACICSGEVTNVGESFTQLVWSTPKSSLVNILSALTGQAVVPRLDFDPKIDLASAEGKSLQSIMMCLADAADTVHGRAASLMLGELEQALAMVLLCAANHNHRHLLDRTSPAAAPWQVHRVEGYIEANWREPLRIEDIVAITGASARSIFRTFAGHRGYSPMEFLKRVRLQHAKRMLGSGNSSITVTEVALSCGFGDLSRFSKDFLAAFGEPPSAVLKRQRTGREKDATSPVRVSGDSQSQRTLAPPPH